MTHFINVFIALLLQLVKVFRSFQLLYLLLLNLLEHIIRLYLDFVLLI